MPFLNNTSGSAAVPSSSGNAPDLNNQNNKKSRLRSHLQDDTSTHGSRTIDSRYSNDKTLGLSDGDEDDNDEDDEEVEDYGEERVMGNGGGDADEEGCSSKLPGDVAVVCDCGQANCEGSVEGQRVPSEVVKLPIKMSSSATTDNESQQQLPVAVTNPNKIYSRKEVITTSYKEEVKNTHLEEYHQTTTFYDNKEPLSSSSSLLTTVNPQHQAIYIELNKEKNKNSSRLNSAANIKPNYNPYAPSGRSSSSFLNQSIEIQNKSNKAETENAYNSNKINLENDDDDDENDDDNVDDQGKRLNPLDSNKLSSSSIISSSDYVMNENAENINNNNTKVLLSAGIVNVAASNNLNKNFCKDMKKTGDDLVGVGTNNNNNSHTSDPPKHKSTRHHHKHRCHKNPEGDTLSKDHRHHHHSCHKHNPEYREQKRAARKQHNKTATHQAQAQLSGQHSLSLKKLTKTPIFLTSTLNEPVSTSKTKSSSSKNKGLILITTSTKTKSGSNKSASTKNTKLANDYFNFMSIDTDSDNCTSKKIQKQNLLCKNSSKLPNHDLTFSLSSSQSTSSLSYLKDLPLQLLTSSSSSSDFSFITKSKQSSSSSINLSPQRHHNTATVNKPQKLISSSSSSHDSLKISMIELNKLSHNLNKKIYKLKSASHSSSSRKQLVAVSSNSKQQSTGLILDESKSLSKPRKHHHQQQKPRSLPRPHKYIEVIDLSKRTKPPQLLSSRSAVSSDLAFVSAASTGEYRKVVNKLDVDVSGSMMVNGSTPVRRLVNLMARKEAAEAECGGSSSTSYCDGAELLMPEQGGEEGGEKTVAVGDYELVPDEAETTAGEEDTTTIREILEKIVESKMQVISSSEEKIRAKEAVEEGDRSGQVETEEVVVQVEIEESDTDASVSSKQGESSVQSEKRVEEPPVDYDDMDGPVGDGCVVLVEEENVVVGGESAGEEEDLEEVVEIVEDDVAEDVVEEVAVDETVVVVKLESPVRRETPDSEVEARIIKKTVYKVLEKASEIVAAEYNLEKSVKQQQKRADLNED